MKRWSTVLDFVSNGRSPSDETVVSLEGFDNKGDGGESLWVKTGSTSTASQTPVERGNNTMTDSSGVEYTPVSSSIFYFDGSNNWFPLPFGESGVGLYQFNGSSWVFYEESFSVSNLSTQDLISSNRNYQEDDVITTTGFGVAGDGGGAQWKATNTIGLTPSQTPADRAAAELVDGSGRLWEFAGNALFLEQVGAVLDGVTDETAIGAAAQDWCNTTGGNIYIGSGSLLTTGFQVDGGELKVYGLGEGDSEIKLKDGTSNHVIRIINGGKVTLGRVTINGNRLNQSAGHGIRVGGCDRLHIRNVEIRDCYSYGIGFQAGTNKDIKIDTLVVHSTGQDGIDIKDFNNNSETVFISNYRAYNYGLNADQQVGLDVRGPIVANNIVLEPSAGTNNFGLRLRPASAQGRAGSGSIINIGLIGDGSSSDHVGLDIASDSGNINISGISIENFQLAARLGSGTTGGNISGLLAGGIFGTDCMSLSGSGWLINNIKLENTATSSRVFDFEASAQNIRMTNVNLTDNSGNTSSARIQSGASNIQIEGGFVTGGTIADSGTSSVINVTYL